MFTDPEDTSPVDEPAQNGPPLDQPEVDEEPTDLETPEEMPDEDNEENGLVDPEDEEPPAAPEPDPEPVVVRAGGQSFTVPGALRAPEGMYIPDEHVDAVLALISRGRHHEMTWPQEQQRYREETRRLEALRSIDTAEAAAWTAEMQKITASEDAWLAFSDNLAVNLEMMKHRVMQARVGKENEMLKQGIRLEPQEMTGEEFARAASESLVSYFDEVASAPELAALLPAADREVVWQQVARQAGLYITKAPHDVPELGIVKGERVIDVERLAGDVRRFADLLGHGRRGASGEPTRARRMNDAVQTAQPVRRPPARAQGGKPSGAPPAKPQNYNDWRDRLLSLAEQE